MDSFPKEIEEKILNNFSPEELIKYCYNDPKSMICNDNNFWFRRLQKDFLFLIPYLPKSEYKKSYLEIFNKVSKNSEEMTENILNTFGEFQKFLTKEYKKELYNFLYKFSLDTLNHVLELKEEEDQEKLSEENVYEYTYDFGDPQFDILVPSMIIETPEYTDYWNSKIIDKNADLILKLIEYLNLIQ